MNLPYILFISFLIIVFLHQTSHSQIDKIPGKYTEILEMRNKLAQNPQINQMMSQCIQEVSNKAQENNSKEKITNDQFQTLVDECFVNKFKGLPVANLKEMSAAASGLSTEGIDNFNYQSNPAFKKLREYLKERLEQSFYGKPSTQLSRAGKFVDHDQYYKLYKDQLENNILSLISAYCVNATDKGLQYSDPVARRELRLSNIQKLSQEAPGGQNQAFIHYQTCIRYISPICGKAVLKRGNNSFIDFSSDTAFGTNSSFADIDYTRGQACAVIRQIREIRNALMALKNVDTNLKNETATQGKGQAFYALGPDGFEGIFGSRNNPNEKTLDDLTSIASNELVNTSGLGQSLNQNLAQYQQFCIKNMTPECQQILYNAVDYNNFNNNIKKEYLARTVAVSGKIRTMNDQQLKKFLMQEGRTEAEIQRMYNNIRNSKTAKTLQQSIADRFETERLEIIKEMTEKYKKFNVQNTQNSLYGQRNPAGPQNPKDSLAMRRNVEAELKLRPEELKETFHFHNIVTGYLQLSQGGKVIGQNVKSALNELNNSSFKNTGLMGQNIKDPAYFQNLQAQTRKNLKQTQKTDQSYSSFSVEQINNLIIQDYGNEAPKMNPNNSNITPTPNTNK